ncbi:bacillithiol biosynthesis deacetylase BshB1 [Bacillus sp. FSL K6-3431]|uniref:bacillithiol biosynthesis deacetylase BshB1 n=1 Tax=Bacillus sp. FSL K6-3431 TaxID=2921500 RepID=UPI0030F6E770
MEQQKIDVLAFGAHADDVEIGMAGTIAKWTEAGKEIVICELTEADLSSNGSVALRKEEAALAASLLGVSERINLQIPDRGLFMTDKHIRMVTEVIRKYQPKIIFAPYHEDRHPDHGNCARLVREAYFSAGIKKYNQEESNYRSYKAQNLFQYLINGYTSPDFVVDISNFIEQKKSALSAYQSQFLLEADGVMTPLTDGYIDSVIAREQVFGKDAGVRFAEGFKTNRPILLNENLFGDKI